MTKANQLIDRIERAGGVLTVQGERIRCLLTEEASSLLDELRASRGEVLLALRRRETIPTMPPDLRLVRWNLKDPPVLIESCALVVDPSVFVRATLGQLRVAMANPKRWVGWSVAQLIERLAQVGVTVMLEEGVNIR